VLGAVSMAWTARARRQRRGAEAVFAFGLTVLVAVFGVVIVAMPWAVDMVQGLRG
jgi:hypothetical protein